PGRFGHLAHRGRGWQADSGKPGNRQFQHQHRRPGRRPAFHHDDRQDNGRIHDVPGGTMKAPAPSDSRHATRLRRGLKAVMLIAACVALTACASYREPLDVGNAAQLTPATPSTHDLLKLPEPKGRIVVAVYGFRDQTGQYKPSP